MWSKSHHDRKSQMEAPGTTPTKLPTKIINEKNTSHLHKNLKEYRCGDLHWISVQLNCLTPEQTRLIMADDDELP